MLFASDDHQILHDKVCANINQLKQQIKIDNSLFWVIIFN